MLEDTRLYDDLCGAPSFIKGFLRWNDRRFEGSVASGTQAELARRESLPAGDSAAPLVCQHLHFVHKIRHLRILRRRHTCGPTPATPEALAGAGGVCRNQAWLLKKEPT